MSEVRIQLILILACTPSWEFDKRDQLSALNEFAEKSRSLLACWDDWWSLVSTQKTRTSSKPCVWDGCCARRVDEVETKETKKCKSGGRCRQLSVSFDALFFLESRVSSATRLIWLVCLGGEMSPGRRWNRLRFPTWAAAAAHAHTMYRRFSI